MAKMMKPARVSYDTHADTFYFTMKIGAPGRYHEDDDGLVWRYDLAGRPLGVTVQAYHLLWNGRHDVLATRIAGPFELDVSVVAKRLPA